jgi:MFS family permease
MIYVGRAIAGFGVGMISNTAPVFVAECSPKQLRGIMMAAFETFLVSGGMIAYWTVYGCSLHMHPTLK